MQRKLIHPMRLALEEEIWTEIGALAEEIAAAEEKPTAEASLEALGQWEALIAEAEGFTPRPTVRAA